MGKYKHHSGSVGGGVNLSKGKTPHDKDIEDMPLFKMGKPYSMGASMRGPLDKNVKVNSWEEEDVKRGRKQMAEGHKGHAEALFDDAHGSWNWSKSHHSTGPELNDKKKKRKEKAFNRKATKVYENARNSWLTPKSTQRKANAAARKYQKHLAEPGETITNVAGVPVSPVNKKKGKISEKRAFKKVEKGKATVHYKSGKSGEVIIKQPGRRDKVIKNYNSLQQ